MKRIFLVIFLIILVLGITRDALAVSEYNTFYFEGVATDRTNYNGERSSWNQTMITAEVPLAELKLGFDVTSGMLENSQTQLDILNYKIKGGYALINNEQTRFDLTAGWFNGEYAVSYDLDKNTYQSFLIGFDAKIMLSDYAWFDLNYAYGVNPRVTSDYLDAGNIREADMDSLTLTNCRITFQVTDEIGLSLGYTVENLNTGSSDPYLSSVKNSGFTAGISYFF
jgi:hypothetical protein